MCGVIFKYPIIYTLLIKYRKNKMINTRTLQDIGMEPISPAYNNLSWMGIFYANSVYQKIKDQDQEVLEENCKSLSPVGFWDNLSFMFDTERIGKLAATKRVLLERAQKN